VLNPDDSIARRSLKASQQQDAMDIAMIRDHLALAEGHVRLGAMHIVKQQAIVSDLERDGLDTAMARELLTTFEQMQLAHVADRDRLAKELAWAAAQPPA
jgi:hypothetical protein